MPVTVAYYEDPDEGDGSRSIVRTGVVTGYDTDMPADLMPYLPGVGAEWKPRSLWRCVSRRLIALGVGEAQFELTYEREPERPDPNPAD